MNAQVGGILVGFLYLLLLAVIARSLITWFPVNPRSPLVRFLSQVTEPLLEPVRRLLPRTGMIDFSGMIVVLVLYLMIEVVRQVSH